MKKRRSGIMFTVHRYLISYVPKLILLNHTWAALSSRWQSAAFSGSVIILHLDEIAFRFPSHYRKLFFPAGLFPERFPPVFLMTKNKLHLNCLEQLAAVSSRADNNSNRELKKFFVAVKRFRGNRKDFRAEIQFCGEFISFLAGLIRQSCCFWFQDVKLMTKLWPLEQFEPA